MTKTHIGPVRQGKKMKQNTSVAAIACMNQSMSTSALSPAAEYSPAPPQPLQPTPSPFSFSVASTRLNSRPSIQMANLFLRFLALILFSASAISLAAMSPTNSKLGQPHLDFWAYPELLYLFSVNILEFSYAAYQLSKGICDTAHRGIFISDMLSDYISFIFDQLAAYLLVSASSAAVPAIKQMNSVKSPLLKAAIVSVCMSFTSVLVIAATALISGYKFCKRIIW